MNVDPLHSGSVPVAGVEIRRHRPEVTVVLGQINVGFRGHLRVTACVSSERPLNSIDYLVDPGVCGNIIGIQ